MDWLYFTLGSLAVFRLSLLVSKESGPAFIFRKLRRLPEKGSATKEGLGCQWCTSIYSSALVATFFYWQEKVSGREWVLFWLAFSAAAIAVNQTFTRGK